MNAGDKITYQTSYNGHGVLVAIVNGVAEIVLNTAGWLAKPNVFVPVGQVVNPKVGDDVKFVAFNVVSATVVTPGLTMAVVVPDYWKDSGAQQVMMLADILSVAAVA